MTKTLTKKEELNEKVEKALSVLAEDVLDDVVEFACKLAKHRGSNVLRRDDIGKAFEKKLKVKVPTKMHQASGTSAASSNAPRQTGQTASLPQQPVSTKYYSANLQLVKKH